jgi:NAD(P)-dependent dehydrogenase (short-subunit alcohol dehydrogenase family)
MTTTLITGANKGLGRQTARRLVHPLSRRYGMAANNLRGALDDD